MSFEAFLMYFDHVSVCKLLDGWTVHRVRGAWMDHCAGGPHSARNPQYLLYVPPGPPATCFVNVGQASTRRGREKYRGAIGVTVVDPLLAYARSGAAYGALESEGRTPVASDPPLPTRGLPPPVLEGARLLSGLVEGALHELVLERDREAAVTVALPGRRMPFVVTPTIESVGMESVFHLSVFTDRPTRLVQVPYWLSPEAPPSPTFPTIMLAHESVPAARSGGCANTSRWRRNTQHSLAVLGADAVVVTAILEQHVPAGSSKTAIGFYVASDQPRNLLFPPDERTSPDRFRAWRIATEAHRLALASAGASADAVLPASLQDLMLHRVAHLSVVKNSPFATRWEVAMTIRLEPGMYKIIPSTFDSDVALDYTLRVVSQDDAGRFLMTPATEWRTCDHCRHEQWVEGTYCGQTTGFWAGPNLEAIVHVECANLYPIDIAPRCAECSQPILGRYITFKGRDGQEAQLHPECRDAYIRRTSPPCAVCGLAIAHLDGFSGSSYTVGNGGKVHSECYGPYLVSVGRVCSHCTEPLMEVAGRFSGRSRTTRTKDSSVQSTATLHEECHDSWLRAEGSVCAHCGELVKVVEGRFSGRYFTVADGTMVHEECMEAWEAARAPRCFHCGESGSGRRFDVADVLRERGLDVGGLAVVHADCKAPFMASIAPLCLHCWLPVTRHAQRPDGSNFSGSRFAITFPPEELVRERDARAASLPCSVALAGKSSTGEVHSDGAATASTFAGASDTPAWPLRSSETLVHAECYPAYLRRLYPVCFHCGEALVGFGSFSGSILSLPLAALDPDAHAEAGAEQGKAQLHAECVDAMLAARGIHCAACKQVVYMPASFSRVRSASGSQSVIVVHAHCER